MPDEPDTLDALREALGAKRFPPDFEGGRYKGFEIVHGQPSGFPSSHEALAERFYVLSPRGQIGLVPFAGSQIIWPWEAGWTQDMRRPEVHAEMKEQKERRKRG